MSRGSGETASGDPAGPFWDAASAGVLLLQYCASCRRYIHFPLPTCPTCHSDEGLGWRKASGQATVHTFTVVHRSRFPSFRGREPYAVICGELVEQEGLRMFANLVRSPLTALRIGQPLQVVFEEQDGVVLPQFTITERSGGDETLTPSRPDLVERS